MIVRKAKAAGPVTGAELNAWIREVSGHGPPAIEPAQDQAAAPAPIPTANAGNHGTVDVPIDMNAAMNQMIRSGRGRSWTVNG